MGVDRAQARSYRGAMTNRIALGIALFVAAFVAVDLLLGLGASLSLARRFTGLIDWMAFWR